MEKRISTSEAARRLGTTDYFVRQGIINGTIPGSYITGPSGRNSFIIIEEKFENWRKENPVIVDRQYVDELKKEISSDLRKELDDIKKVVIEIQKKGTAPTVPNKIKPSSL